MADNSIPTTYDPLIQLGEDAADGAHTHGATVGLLQNTEDRIRMELEALTGTTGGPGGKPPPGPGLKALWNAAQANKSAQTAAFRTVCSNARFYARMCIRSLFPVLGEHWNAQWNAAGFTGGSLSVPANPMTLLQQFRAYYTAHPAYETTVQGVACNAATCETTAQAISTAESASNQSNTDSGAAYANYLQGIKTLRARLGGLRDELSRLMSDDDDRWYAFGFEKPSDPNTPETPANLTVVPGTTGSHMGIADWDAARRATSYRFRAVLKADGTEVASEIVQDSQFTGTFADLSTGTVVLINVTGRNATGESLACEPVEFAVP